MQNQIDTLRQLNYELIKNLGLFRQRAGLSFGQRHTLYHINAHQGLSIQELAELLQVDHSTMSRNVKKLMQADLVETFQDDADKRRKMIALSAVGKCWTKRRNPSTSPFPMLCNHLMKMK